MQAMLSITGLYNYDNTIFDDMHLPEGVDRDTVLQKILIDNAELGLVYTDPAVVKMLIANWSSIHAENWGRIHAALTAEYDPISNYDRRETWTDTGNSSSEQTTGTERKVAGWNTAPTTETAEAVENSGTGSSSSSNTRTGRAYGNIGVTTNQQMIEAEMQLRSTQTLPEIISDSFKSNFCIMVY